MNGCMPVRRLTSILAAVLAVLGLSALPTASLARSSAPASHRAVDDGTATDATSLDDPGDPTDTPVDVCDTTTSDGLGSTDLGDSGDTTGDGSDSTDPTDPTDARQADPADDPTASEDDPTSGDPAATTCDTTVEDVGESGDVTGVDSSRLTRRGVVVATIATSGAGTVDSTLTQRLVVLGAKHVSVKKAGVAQVRLRLNSRGRRLLRSSTRALHLTLSTRIQLASGKTFERSNPLTVKPAKKHKKPGRASHR